MTRILFGGAAAVAILVSLSGARRERVTTARYYWFITDNVSVLRPEAIIGFDIYGEEGTVGCPGGMNFCEVAYSISQVNTTGFPLHVVTSVKTAQVPFYKAVMAQEP